MFFALFFCHSSIVIFSVQHLSSRIVSTVTGKQKLAPWQAAPVVIKRELKAQPVLPTASHNTEKLPQNKPKLEEVNAFSRQDVSANLHFDKLKKRKPALPQVSRCLLISRFSAYTLAIS